MSSSEVSGASPKLKPEWCRTPHCAQPTNYPAARSVLEKAVLADSENWVPHSLLADTYLHQQDYKKARDEALLAIKKGKASASSAHVILGEALVVGLKGRAWITAGNLQIVRIEAEMIQPMPEIQLLGEHQVVEYGPVPFPKKNTTLWLPKTAEIYFDFRKHHYYRRHSFDHYMLFAVDTEEKRKEPASTPPSEKRPQLSAPGFLK